ncbi:hypothetical protein ACQKM9_15300 [Viridibacillus sp. NPDC093762]|uniref:hypothetical protein n=1 Tax=Viridibacillus sp. NPDC093762 TaxID=3390720 RepID=UPI003D01525C
MDDKQFEDRMKLLKKSYDKVPSQFQLEKIVGQIESENQQLQTIEQIKKPRKNRQKLIAWAISIASIFILSILGATFLFENKKQMQQGSDGQYTFAEVFEDIEKDYPVAREKNRKLLKMKEKDFVELGFVNSADSRYDFYKKLSKDEDRKMLYSENQKDEYYKEAMRSIQLPQQLLYTTMANETTLTDTEARVYISEYYDRSRDLINYYNNLFMEHSEDLDFVREDGNLEWKRLFMNKDKLPQILQNAIDSAEIQNLGLKIVYNNVIFGFNSDVTTAKLEGTVTARLLDYFTILHGKPFTYGGDLVHSIDETVFLINTIEKTWSLADQQLSFFDELKGDYTNAVYSLLKGSNSNPVMDATGKVNKEYRDAWLNLLENDPKFAPTLVYLKPIVDEFEASNWTSSKHWENLQFSDIEDAVNHSLYESFISTSDANYSEIEKTIGTNFESRIHSYYKLFSETHNQAVLKDAKALEVVGLYYYSFMKGDYDTVYELFVKGEKYGVPSKEKLEGISFGEYLGKNTRLSEIFERMTFVQLETDRDDDVQGVARIVRKKEDEIDLLNVCEFRLIKEENGWRIPLNPTK